MICLPCSTIALSDAFGTNTTSYTYDPFGKTTQMGAASDNTFQYTGRESDATGLYYFRARYYSPGTERFISEDPLGLSGGNANYYTYAWNNPLTVTDPSGLSGEPPPIPPEYPGDGFEPRGGEGGAWFNPETGESWHPDLEHPDHGPHWDYRQRPYTGGAYTPTAIWNRKGRTPGQSRLPPPAAAPPFPTDRAEA